MFANTFAITYNLRMPTPKEKKTEVIWDKKRIFIFVLSAILILILGFELKTLTLDKNVSLDKAKNLPTEQVQGASTQQLPDVRQGIVNQIDNLKNEAQNINVVEVATSSSQVQKVINDLKSLQDLPKSQLKTACEKVCSGL